MTKTELSKELSHVRNSRVGYRARIKTRSVIFSNNITIQDDTTFFLRITSVVVFSNSTSRRLIFLRVLVRRPWDRRTGASLPGYWE